MVFSYLPFCSPLGGWWFIGNGTGSGKSPFSSYWCACCSSGFVSSNTPNPVSLAIFWKQVYTSSAILLNHSKKPYCNFKSLEGKGLLVLFVSSRCLLEVVIATADSLGRGEDNNQRICTKSAASSSCSGRCASLCSSDAIGGWWDVCSLLPTSAHVWL